jgi:hypothetical protein
LARLVVTSVVSTNPEFVARKSERRQAREVVAEYHAAQLADLVARVAEASDRFRNGELNAFDVDHVLFQYSRAAKELWTFCNTGDVELTARQVREVPPIAWWEPRSPEDPIRRDGLMPR